LARFVGAVAIFFNGNPTHPPSTKGSNMDFSGILVGLPPPPAVTAVVGAGALIAAVGFASWAAKKVAGFFGR